MASQPIRALGKLNAIVQEGMSAADRVFDLFDQEPRVIDSPDAARLEVTRGEIVFENVDFSYGDGPPALKGVSLVIGAGERVALVGRSGAGKSSLFNLIPRLYDVTGGRLTVDGVDVRDVTLASLRDQIAVVSQDAVLFDDTIGANIGFGDREAGPERIEAAAADASAARFIEADPDRYAAQVGTGGDRLSGGERQRIAIARAILKDAPILLLDEATSALDAESEHAVREALERLATGRTTLVIAHRLSTVMDADRIVVMDAGRIAESGVHDELISKGGLYADLFRLQFQGVSEDG